MDHSDNAKLADAFSLLCSQKRTGKLLIREEGREGAVFIADGGITHAQFDRYSGLLALLFMLSWEGATYNFTPKQANEDEPSRWKPPSSCPSLRNGHVSGAR